MMDDKAFPTFKIRKSCLHLTKKIFFKVLDCVCSVFLRRSLFRHRNTIKINKQVVSVVGLLPMYVLYNPKICLIVTSCWFAAHVWSVQP